MHLVLKRFSQDVDLADPGNVLYYLVFDNSGAEVRLPVPKETSEALIQLVYGSAETAPAPAPEEDLEDHQGEYRFPVDPDPDVFGDDDDAPIRIPSSEGEVPSI